MHSVIDSIVTDWSRDGRRCVLANELGTNWNTWAMRLAGQDAQPVLRANSARWTRAYPRMVTGSRTCLMNRAGGYVQPFLSPGGKWQISSSGGNAAVVHSGKELFYVASDQKLMAVPIHAGNPGSGHAETTASRPRVYRQFL
jgi:hypothetical protein